MNLEVSIFTYRIQRERTARSDQGHALRHVKHKQENVIERIDVERIMIKRYGSVRLAGGLHAREGEERSRM